MEKESLFNFPEKSLREIRRVSNSTEKRVVVGFRENEFGEAVVTTGVPVQYQPDKTSYVKKKTMSYEQYMFNEQQKLGRRR